MKTLYCFTLAIFLSFVGISQSTNGLISHYKFNGNPNDGFGGITGVNSGAIPTADRFGVKDSAYYFDGTSKIQLGTASDYTMDSSEFSISFWFKRDAGNQIGFILGKRVDVPTFEQYGVWIMDDISPLRSGKRVYSYFKSSNPGGQAPFREGVSVNVDTSWHHVVVVQSVKSLRTYLDTVLIGEDTTKMVGQFNVASTSFIVGYTFVNAGGQDLYFKGAVDDLWIYKKALADSTIKKLLAYQDDTTNAGGQVGAKEVTENQFESNQIQLYPNPTSKTLRILYSQKINVAVVMSITGEIVKEVSGDESNEIHLEVGDLPAGIYFAKIADRSNQSVIRRFIKQ